MKRTETTGWSLRSRCLEGVLPGMIIAATSMSGWAVAAELAPAQIYASAAPATVFILGVSEQGGTSGTGSIIDATGLILTNAHVIMDDKIKAPYKTISVFLKPARVTGRDKDNLVNRYKATVVAYQQAVDLAVLKLLEPPPQLPILPLGDPSAINIGSRVVAIGHPERGGLWSLTTGVISAEWQDYGGVPGWDIFQTETSLNRGNSGGPLIDEHGHQIGVNSFIQRKSEDGLAITSINFAIKSNVARDWLARQGIQVAYATRKEPPAQRPAHDRKDEGSATRPQSPSSPSAESASKKAPAKVLENQPEAPPETGPGLPPLRPYDLDRLVRGLAQVEKDLESQMDEMQAEIRKRR